jgi:hypothetical protein
VAQRIDQRRNQRSARAMFGVRVIQAIPASVGIGQVFPAPVVAVEAGELARRRVRLATVSDHVGLSDAENVHADAPAMATCGARHFVAAPVEPADDDSIPTSLRHVDRSRIHSVRRDAKLGPGDDHGRVVRKAHHLRLHERDERARDIAADPHALRASAEHPLHDLVVAEVMDLDRACPGRCPTIHADQGDVAPAMLGCQLEPVLFAQ